MATEKFPRSNVLDGKEIIDLSSEIYEGMPVYPSHQKTSLFNAKTHEETRAKYGEGALTTTTLGVLISDHGPTHTDALYHFDSSEDAETIEEMPIHMFYTGAICADVTHIREPDDYLTVEGLQEALSKDDLEINTGDTVLLHTGHWNRNWGTDDWLHSYGGLTRGVTEWLAQKGVVNIGVDAPSVDSSAEVPRRERNADDHYPAHQVCKEEGLTNTENMCNLDKVSGERFLYTGFPLKIRAGTGSPVRAVAIVDRE